MATKKDFAVIAVIGFLVGLLIQPVLSNNAEQITSVMALGTARLLVFVSLLVLAPLALFIASLLGKLLPVLYQFAKFAAVGVLNTMVDLGVFNLAYFFYGAYPTGQIFSIFKSISFLSGTTNSFFWNKFWTFEATETISASQTIKFYAVAIGGGLINIGVATFVFNHPSATISQNLWGSLIAPLSGILTAFLWDFLGYKFFVFKKHATPATR